MYNFFIALQKFVNEQKIIPLYYEEASKKANFPYGVISDPIKTCLRYGELVYFDIFIWTTEPNTGIELEKKLQDLIKLLDGKIFSEERAVIYFEEQRPISDPEYTLIKKQITFSIRLF